MKHLGHTRLTKILASLVLAVMVYSPVLADRGNIVLPRQASEPVIIRFPKGEVDWQITSTSELLQVFVATTDSCCEGRTPMAGRYEAKQKTLSFTPTFGFVTDKEYFVRTQIAGRGEELIKFRISSETARTQARVTKVYPSGDTLPENVLRFYIHFSMPMSPHMAFDHIKLRDSSGKVDQAAFMKFKQELWNQDRTRLTVLIDPGRIKRNVATNKELGPALIEEKAYTLEVDQGWPSADGLSSLPSFAKSFSVVKALREKPDLRFWKSSNPCLGTREALEIYFSRPFDRHQLSDAIIVTTPKGKIISGSIYVGENESSWRFVPKEKWATNQLLISVDDKLEDVAGNNFRELLDQSMSVQNDSDRTTSLIVQLKNCFE